MSSGKSSLDFGQKTKLSQQWSVVILALVNLSVQVTFLLVLQFKLVNMPNLLKKKVLQSITCIPDDDAHPVFGPILKSYCSPN